MLKGIKRAMCIIVVVAMVLLCAPCAVYANTNSAEQEKQPSPNKQLLYSAKGNEVETKLVEDLKAHNIIVNNETVIGVLSDGNALRVTNKKGTVVDQNVIVAVGANSQIKRLAFGNKTSGEQIYGGELDPLGDSIVLVFAVRYNVVLDGVLPYYQPQYAQMILYNRSSSTVTDMKMQYITQGYECSLPDFVNLTGPAGTYFRHTMECVGTLPNRYYVATNAYRTDRVICIDDGAHYVYAEFTVNGIPYWDDFWIC